MEEAVTAIKPSKSQMAKKKRARRLKQLKKDKWLYFLMLPGVLLTLVFRYFPMYGAIIAFKDYNPMLGILDSPWVAFEHFR